MQSFWILSTGKGVNDTHRANEVNEKNAKTN